MVALALVSDAPSAPAKRSHLRLVPRVAGLTAAERQAVEIGRDDAFRYGWDAGVRPSRWTRLVARLTGIRSVMPLADARLEALRLFAAMMRRDDRRVHDLADALLEDGLAEAALHQAVALALG
jgi:hypothetical protein